MKGILTIRIPEEMKRELARLSKSEKLPISDLIRESIHHYLAVKNFRKLRRKTLPFAEAQGLLTDDDIFKLIS